MILEPGDWLGRGSFRPTNESLGTSFRVRAKVSEDAAVAGRNFLVDAQLEIDGGGKRAVSAWIVADEFGTYAVTVRGDGFQVEGSAKLESEPHLALLWNESGDVHVSCALFALPDSRGLRGFAKTPKVTWTWELALRPTHLAAQAPSKRGKVLGNVVSLASRRKRR